MLDRNELSLVDVVMTVFVAAVSIFVLAME